MGSVIPGASRPQRRRWVALIVVAVLAGAAGSAGWWFGRGMLSHQDEGVQQGTFSLDVGEEKKIAFPRPYVASPHLEVEDSNRFFRVTEVQPSYFKAKAQPGSAVQNQPWKAQGVLAP